MPQGHATFHFGVYSYTHASVVDHISSMSDASFKIGLCSYQDHRHRFEDVMPTVGSQVKIYNHLEQGLNMFLRVYIIFYFGTGVPIKSDSDLIFVYNC